MQTDEAFLQAIEDKIFSGAQIILGRGTHTLFSKNYGNITQESSSAIIDQDTLFDIASLTKPVGTTTLCMMALQERKIALDDPVQNFLPEFVRHEKITLRHLLAHTSGLPAWLPLYQEVVGKGYDEKTIRRTFIQSISESKSEAKVGGKRIYSDLGFILLGFILEEVYQTPLAKLFTDKVATSLGLSSLIYSPISSAERLIAATEACPWRGKTLQGEVHDDNAYVLGGAAGHAGLFSNAASLEKFLHELISIFHGKKGIVSRQILDLFIGKEISTKLGWDTVSPTQSQAGTRFSTEAIGHLGFTGCSLWWDLQDEKYIILLTNRVHPTRENEGIKQFRPQIHDVVIQEF